MWSDLRNAIRALRAAPGFTTTALIVLALGIGASSDSDKFATVDHLVPLARVGPHPHALVHRTLTARATRSGSRCLTSERA